jgi:hypothetical protein
MNNEETYIYSSENMLKSEKEFQSIFNNWKNKNNITTEGIFINNDILSLENEFNTKFLKWKQNLKKKKIVYTAIIGKYDNLHEPKIYNEDWEYICFTDNPNILRSKYWKIIDINLYSELKNINKQILLARVIKWSPTYMFENIEYSIWVDANMVINVDLNKFINLLPKNVPIILTKHPNRNCIYQEIIAIKSRIDRGIVKENINGVNKWALDLKYKNKYPENNGLCQTGLKIHNHKFTENLYNIGKMMRSIMNQYDIIRDQLIFNYICYKLKIFRYDLDSLPSIQNKEKGKYNFYLDKHNF